MDIASNFLTLISSIFIVLRYDEDPLDLFVIAASAKEVVGLWEIQRANELWQRDNRRLCRLFHDNSNLCYHGVNLPRKIYFLAPPGALRIIPTYLWPTASSTSLTQHISWPNRKHKWRPLGTTWELHTRTTHGQPFGQLGDHLKTGWKTPRHHLEQHGGNLGQHQDNFKTTLSLIWDNFDTTLGQS